jgi:8-oxo-dGTP pyrophosphatase MutT (NUDIX family)
LNADFEEIMVVDENDQIAGSALRNEVLANNLWRRTSGGMVYDPASGYILCHRRSSMKDERAGVWVATFGGKCSPGETPKISTQRELEEEFGLHLEGSAFKFVGKFKSVVRHQFEYLFIVEILGGWKQVHVEHQHEVAESGWFPLSDVRDKLSLHSDWYSYGYEEKLLTSVESNLL